MQDIAVASPVATVASGSVGTITITIPEPGVVRLADLVVSILTNDIAGPGTLDVFALEMTRGIFIRQITVNGVIIGVTGRNTPVIPAGWFAADRAANWLQLPEVRMDTAGTIVITFIFTRTDMGSVAASAAVPLMPDRLRGVVDAAVMGLPGEQGLGSPSATMDGAGDDITLTITSDVAGYVDMSRISIYGLSTLPQTVDADGYRARDHDEPLLNVNSLILGTNTAFVVGTTPTCPSAFRLDRSRNLFHFGVWSIGAGQAIVAVCEVLGVGTTLDGLAAMSVPFWPLSGSALPGPGGACDPCKP